MTIIEIIDTFSFYGFDVAILASLTMLSVQLLKITLFKKAQKKLLTFMPFVLGTIYYAIYQAIYNGSFSYVLNEYTNILEHGISVGALATLTYVLYEQFVRQKKSLSSTQSVIATLIDGYVPDSNLENTAKMIAEAIEKDVVGNGANKTAEIILQNAENGVDERDVALLSKLIIETLAHINAS